MLLVVMFFVSSSRASLSGLEAGLPSDSKRHPLCDEVAEWLRRWTANPLWSPRVGSNPILVDLFLSTLLDFHKFTMKNVRFDDEFEDYYVS